MGSFRLQYLTGATLAAILNGPPSLAQPGGGPPPAMVTLAPCRVETLEQWREVTGELQPLRRSLLASQEEGWVVDFPAREGDLVHEGDVIARMDPKLATLEMSRAEAGYKKWDADVAEREADLTKRQRDLEKLRASFSKGAASETEVSDAETNLATAKARLDRSKAERDSARAESGMAGKRLENLTVRAPITGRVSARRTEVGQWLKRGDAVVEIVQLDVIEAWLDVPEAIAAGLGRRVATEGVKSTDTAEPMSVARPSAEPVKVQVRITGLGEGGVREAEVAGIVPRADPLSRLIPVRVRLANKDEMITPGMSVTGLVPSGRSEPTLTIHKDALLRNDAGTYVYFSGGGVAQIARVEVLFAAKDRLAVRSERLKPGMEVVVEGNERLFPGQPLVAGAPAPAPAPAPVK